ncbi:cytochrome P450 6k1-like [Venturia canescens]|uniref:cytochrome P450 6k1-like n=1 Tax=Venturia canescens TaxID=32260 RepID=UPI001C9C249D|nr:cytochrome P450 6k1-like [Venturia canescens]
MFSSWSSFLLTCLIGLLGIFYLRAKWKLSYWQRRGIPSLPTNLIFGNFKDSFLLKIAPGFLLGRLYSEAKEDDAFIGVYILHQPFLLLRSPDLIKKILVKDFAAFPNRFFASPRDSTDLVGSRGLFSIHNPEWRYLRTKLSPTFTTGKLKSLFNLMLESSEFLNSYMKKRFDGDDNAVKKFEFKDTSTRFTTDVISSLAFGIRTNSFEDPPPEFYTRSRGPFTMTILRALRLSSAFFFPGLSKYLGGSMLGENTDYFRKVFWNSMNSREEGKYERGDVIDGLLKLKNDKSEDGFEIQGDTLVAQSAIFFVAGLETSSTTMAFTLWELAKQPEIQKRLRSHILENLGDGRKITYESVQNMKYLMAVINETLRMYPPAPLIDRVADRDYKIPGTQVVLEKGTVVYVALPGIQMDPKYFSDPKIYDPDRFSEERKSDIKPFTFMPFGEGPRICIGLRVGMLQTAVGLITILRDYEVLLNPRYTTNGVSPRSAFTIPAAGILLDVKKISND